MAISKKPRCNGQWTEARFNSFIASALRGATRRWAPRNQCIKNARVERGKYRCEGCNQIVPATLPPKKGNKRRIRNIVADHIAPIVDPSVGFTTWDSWIERAFCEAEGFQALCHECHTKKSNEEKAIARQRKKKA